MPIQHDRRHTFTQWLKARREALGLTQDALAERLGYASPTIQKVERGERRPSHELATRLAEALEIPEPERPRFLQLARARPAEPGEADAEAPPTPRPPAVPHLPAPPAELIGREAERAALCKQLREGGRHLLTLLGPGGIGKTSLALQVAADLAADPTPFADGAAMAPLAPIATAADVPGVVAEALTLPLQGSRSPADQLLDALQGRRVLLVLDNCEHLLVPGEVEALLGLIRRLLAGSPGLSLLVTSRERLGIPEEWVVTLAGLEVPPADTGPRVERAAAVRLFLARMERVAPKRPLSPEDRALIAHICRRLEGTPLAIELAAAWTRALTPHEIAAELDRALDFLTHTDRTAPARHHSLRATLDYSWRRLDVAEQRALACLSVFQGGCEREAAWEVAGASLPILGGLIDKSLIRAEAAGVVTRYTLHELVRQYATEQLSADPAERRATEARHIAYYAALLQRSLTAQSAWASREAWVMLMRNLDNVRAAWLSAAAAGNTRTLLAMARGMMLLYGIYGSTVDAAGLFAWAASVLREAGDGEATDMVTARGVLLGYQGFFLNGAGRTGEALPALEEGRSLLQAAGDEQALANLLVSLGSANLYAARFEAALACYTQAARLTETSDRFTHLWATLFLGVAALLTGDLPAAERVLQDNVEAWRAMGLERGLSNALVLLGETLRLGGRVAEAEALVREGLQIAATTRDGGSLGIALRELGALAVERGELEEAHYLFAESYESLYARHDYAVAGRSRAMLVRVEIARGDLAAASAGCGHLLRLARAGMKIMLPEAAYGLALLRVAEGDDLAAWQILGALTHTPGEHDTLQRVAALRDALHDRLSPEQRAAFRAPTVEGLQVWVEGALGIRGDVKR